MSFGNTSQPDAPDATETTREAIQAEIDFGPELARTRARAGGDVAEINARDLIRIQKEYGPQLGETMQGMRESIDPEMYALDRQMVSSVRERMKEGLTSDEEDDFRRRFAAQEASAGRLGAPVGSVNMARQLTMQDYAAKQNAYNQALSLTGRLGMTPQGFQVGSADTSSNYLGAFSNMANNNYSVGSQAATAAGAQQASMINAGIGAVGELGGSLMRPI